MRNARKRPLAVTIISFVYILTGAAGLFLSIPEIVGETGLYMVPGFKMSHSAFFGMIGIALVRLIAIVVGVFMLRGANWARWLALAWMAFHVYVGALHGWQQALTHAAFLVVIAFFLLKKPEAEYFRSQGSQTV